MKWIYQQIQGQILGKNLIGCTVFKLDANESLTTINKTLQNNMKKSFKIKELEQELWELEDQVYSAKKHGKDLLEYFPLILKAETIRAQITALNWKFTDE